MKDSELLRFSELVGTLEAHQEIHESASAIYGKPLGEGATDYSRGYFEGLSKAHHEAAVKSQRALDKLNQILEAIENA